MKRIISILSAALAFAAVSCQPNDGSPVKADFEYDKTSVLVGEEVNFTDLSEGQITRWTWTFEGGTPETAVTTQPSVCWLDAGTYSVTLRVANEENSDEIVKTKIITVAYHTSISADFEMSKDRAYASEAIKFTNLSTGFPNNIKWTFTPQTGTPVVSTEKDPEINFVPGVYSVKLEISNPLTSDVKTVTNALTILDPNAVTADFSTFSSTIYKDGAVKFTSITEGPVKQYQWTFEGGTPASSTEANPTVTYSTLGKHKVTLKVLNGDNNDTNEKAEYIHVIPADNLIFLLPFDGDLNDYGPNGLNPSVYSMGGLEISFQEGNGHAFSAKFPGGEKGKSYAVLQLPDGNSDATKNFSGLVPPGSDMTFSFWIKRSTVSDNEALIALGDCPGANAAGVSQIWARLQTSNAFRTQAAKEGASGVGSTETNAKFQDGTWHNITIVYANTGKYYALWLDGTRLKEQNYTDTKYEKSTATFPFFIGCNLRFTNNAWAPENMYSGCIDDYVFYKRALTEAEIKALAFAD
jgi:PKD repeat protein